MPQFRSSTAADARLPTAVPSGLLGAGKITLMNHVLNNREGGAWR